MLFSILTKVVLVCVYLLLLLYVQLPTFPFPLQPSDSVQSLEDADTEYPLRRAFFTNLTREQVLDHYQNQLENSQGLSFELPTFKLNYPPEDAYTLIRDQTRSTFLEEIVHPLRESFFVNGFRPKLAKDEIWYKGSSYEQKITVLYKTSNVLVRVFVLTCGFLLLWFLVDQIFEATESVVSEWILKKK